MNRPAEKPLVTVITDTSAPTQDEDLLKQLQQQQVLRHELEMQIEELQKSNRELEISRNKYAL